MTLIRRISTLFKADVHGILDCLEEPETVLKQAVRDMEEQIEKEEGILSKVLAQITFYSQSSECESKALNESVRQIGIAFEANDEALAKTFVRRKLEAQARLHQISSEKISLEQEKSRLEKQIKDHRDELQAITEKMDLFLKSTQMRAGTASGFPKTGKSVSEEEVEIAFYEERKKHSPPSAKAAESRA